MLDLRHPDGDALTETFQQRWVEVQIRRVIGYVDLGDHEGATREARYLADALEDRRIPEAAYHNGAHR